MESSETNIQAYTDVVMNKAVLDWEMQCLQTKIKCKKEENSKLEKQVSERKNVLEKLEKSVNSACEKEQKVKNNINMLRNSRTITEGLLMSMKHQILVHDEKRSETKNVRNNILQKYTTLFESYSKIYSSLPWIQKTTKLKISIEQRKIQLNILKLEYTSFKKKVSLFHRIGDQRIVVAIKKLALDLVARNNLQKEINDLINQQKALESKIIQLNSDKIKLNERLDLKVKEAVAQAKERVVKAQVGSSIEENQLNNVTSSISNCLKPINESIFSRLGLSTPYTLKRPSAMRSKILEKVPCLMETKKAEVPVFESTSVVVHKSNEASKEILESEVAKVISEPSHINNESSKLLMEEGNKQKLAPNKTDKKKKLKKKSKKVKMEPKSSVRNKENQEQNSFIPEGNNITVKEVPLKEKQDELNDKPMEVDKLMADPEVSPLQTSQKIVFEENASSKIQLMSYNESVKELAENKMILMDPDMNNSNMSLLDNISVVSSTFTNENRYQMDRSPDFLTTPSAYCFSPLHSPSKTDVSVVSSETGANSPNYEFRNGSSITTSLFTMETNKEESKAPERSSSDFASFFGTNSQKQNEKSTKNFFQLFG